jgi:hypothetical protein
MGREARCVCRWGADEAEVKVELEGGELMVRGAMRRRAAVAALREVRVSGEALRFRVGDEEVRLELGRVEAERWVKALAKPLPTLARKLGITADSRVFVVGEFAEEGLREALAEAGSLGARDADLMVGCVATVGELDGLIGTAERVGCPVWAVYAKGKGRDVGEGVVREAFRERGFMDVKVASVSEKLTGLRFVKRV